MKSIFIYALGLMLFFEGVLPFLLPQAWRETFTKMTALKDGQLRFVGLISILIGLFLMYLGR